MIIDLHCDTLSRVAESSFGLAQNPFHFDIARARAAGIKAQLFALFSHNQDNNMVLRAILRQIAAYHVQLQAAAAARSVETADDLAAALSQDQLACILHLEGADALGKDAALWPLFHRLGVRSLGLTWNYNNAFAGGVLDTEPTALSPVGRRLLLELERSRSILDLAHVAENSYYQALERFSGPVMVSHANAYTVCRHPRNLNDRQILALAEREGIVGINLVPDFVCATQPDLDRVVDHIDHIASLAGIRYVALGSDFDGADTLLLGGVEDYRELEICLKTRGFSAQECAAVMHDNALAFLTRALSA